MLTLMVGTTAAVDLQINLLDSAMESLKQEMDKSDLSRDVPQLDAMGQPFKPAFKSEGARLEEHPESRWQETRRRGGGVDLMQILWNNFLGSPPVEAGFVPGAAPNGGLGSKRESKRANNSEGAVISVVDFEVVVIPVVNRSRVNISQRLGMKHRFLPRNRSAYVVLDKYPVKMDETATVTKPDSEGSAAVPETGINSKILKFSIAALVMVVACSISCVLGSSVPILWKRRHSERTSVWVTKTGKLFQIRRSDNDVPPLQSSGRVPSPWLT